MFGKGSRGGKRWRELIREKTPSRAASTEKTQDKRKTKKGLSSRAAPQGHRESKQGLSETKTLLFAATASTTGQGRTLGASTGTGANRRDRGQSKRQWGTWERPLRSLHLRNYHYRLGHACFSLVRRNPHSIMVPHATQRSTPLTESEDAGIRTEFPLTRRRNRAAGENSRPDSKCQTQRG